MAVRRETIIHHSQSDDGVIEITQDGDIRSLYFGSNAKQSSMDILQPHRLILSYTQAMMATLLFQRQPKSVLLVGLGAGSIANFMWHHFSYCQIDVAETREDVVKLAHGYFALPIDDRLQIHIGDGSDFIASQNRLQKKYDLILIDAYNHDGMADEVKAKGFFENCLGCMNKDAALSINLWNGETHYPLTVQHLEETFSHKLVLLPVDDRANVIGLASNLGEFPGNYKKLKPIAKELEELYKLPFSNFVRQLKKHNRWRSLARLF